MGEIGPSLSVRVAGEKKYYGIESRLRGLANALLRRELAAAVRAPMLPNDRGVSRPIVLPHDARVRAGAVREWTANTIRDCHGSISSICACMRSRDSRHGSQHPQNQ